MTFLTVVLPVFATIFLGLMARRTGLVEASAFRGLTDVLTFIMMPALLFGTIIRGPPLEVLGVASVYFSGCLAVFAAGVLIARLSGQSLSHAAMLGINASYGNTVMMGIPIAAAALGLDALPPLLGIIAFHSAVLIPLAGILVEIDTADGERPLKILANTVRGTLRNPIILSIISAALWRYAGLPMPAVISTWLQMLGGAAVPLALLCLGGTLPPLKAHAIGRDVVIAIALKLAVLPALVWIIGRSMGLAPLPLAVAVLTAGMPTGANAFLLARRSQELLEISAATVLLATTLSLGTLYVVLYLVH